MFALENERISRAIEYLREAMEAEDINPQNGMPTELFLFASSLIPCANVDLFITDPKKGLLLAWRDDPYCGKGWHIPGGCLRIKESIDHRIQQTAINELGVKVLYDRDTFMTREDIRHDERPWLQYPLERSHNISMLFRCRLPSRYKISNSSTEEHTVGYLKWFKSLPDDLLPLHMNLYGDVIMAFFDEEKTKE